MIIFVGSNPSRAAGSANPFTADTKSYRTLQIWIDTSGIIEDVGYYNVSNDVTPNNRPLTKKEINESIPRLQEALRGQVRIVALGKTARCALEMANIMHCEMPHPSGRNRKLNNTFYVNEQISKLRDYAHLP